MAALRSPQATLRIGAASLSWVGARLRVRAWRCLRRGGGPELERLQSPMRERDSRRHAARVPQKHRGSDSFVPRRRTHRHDTASSPARPVERADDCDRRPRVAPVARAPDSSPVTVALHNRRKLEMAIRCLLDGTVTPPDTKLTWKNVAAVAGVSKQPLTVPSTSVTSFDGR
jgi:hypothetical protein